MARRTRDSVRDIWGERTPYAGEHGWPERIDEHLEQEPERWVQSCCVLCSNGCGLDIGVRDGRMVGVRGRGADRVNRGRLGPKGLHGWMANHSRDRLTRPLIREGGKSPDSARLFDARFREASWEEAMDLVVRRSKEIRERFTGEAIAFYNTGQLFLEDYYTLSIIAHAGIRTNQLDGNTRLCTATAAASLYETFGSDGQPGSFADVDVADCLFLVGHNAASTQTVLWMRILDRLAHPDPPTMIVVDPRRTETAARADLHLAPKLGTNVALLNGILHLLIEAGHIDRSFIDRHTVGFEALAAKVSKYPPERVAEITGVPAEKLRSAAHILGTTPRLLSTCLQGVYQSNQATAAAVQVNNLNLIRGMIGKPGCGILQMNGQPTAQNTRETGCDGEYPGFRNYQNPRHMRDLARLWNVDTVSIPHWSTKEHVMEIFRHAETGSTRMLWITATNPAVSLPELPRIREILAKEDLFVVVNDGFMTETAQLADVVLPAALWGEKTGTFTNADRTVHMSHKAIDPPGEAKSDMEIFLDYARRMDFRDRDGQPLVKWRTPEEAFEAWKECSRGTVCDYSGLSYARLSEGSGIPWPCNDDHPDGAERIYADLDFPTAADRCETFGHDLETGAAITKKEYVAQDPGGRARIKASDYFPPPEQPDRSYPFWVTTGRQVHHFHTRTKTGRSPDLQRAAPGPFVQIHEEDARDLDLSSGDEVTVTTRRGSIQARAAIGGVERGTVFIPFHYGYWDAREGQHRAANELTLTAWDPISKQPTYKFAAGRVSRAEGPSLMRRAAGAARKAVRNLSGAGSGSSARPSSPPPPRSHLSDYLGVVLAAHQAFTDASRTVRSNHPKNPEVSEGLKKLEHFSEQAIETMTPHATRYGERQLEEPGRLQRVLFPERRSGAYGLIRDLQALYLLATETRISTLILEQGAKGLGDGDLISACGLLQACSERQEAWLQTQLKHRAPHTLVVPQ